MHRQKPARGDAFTRRLVQMPMLAAMAMQVWNANTCNAVVGAFNLQGSAWDRKKRQYTTYTTTPPTLDTEIRVKDVPVFSSQPSLVSVMLFCDQVSPNISSCSILQHVSMLRLFY